MIERIVTPISSPHKSRVLVATPRLDDPNFRRAVVLMIEHSSEGSLGLVLNRPSVLPVGDVLPSWGERLGPEAHVHIGGPVEPDALLAVAAAQPDHAGCTPINGCLALVDLGADPFSFSEQVVDVMLFSGYAGWGPRQLDAELAEGAWWVFDSDPLDLRADPGDLWHDVLSRQRSAAALLANHPDDPTWN